MRNISDAAVARPAPRPTLKLLKSDLPSRRVLGYINRLVNVFVRWGAGLKARTLNYALRDKARSDVLFVLRDSNQHQDLDDMMGLRGRPDEVWLADILTELWQADRVEYSAIKIGIGIPPVEWMKATFSTLEKRGGAGHKILADILGQDWQWELEHWKNGEGRI
ncbi:MAG: hypothetical protein WC645_02055 [Candidatus Margulisiibacteriota bacterium]